MNYIILINPGTRAAYLVTDSNGFVEEYYLYDDAIKEAEKYKDSGDCNEYKIYQLAYN